ncbi:MAG: AsmA family protein [Alphaproteobacteria bacterium]
MRTIGYILSGLLAAVLILAIVVPRAVNINDYKPMVQEKASEAIGREVRLDGEISLSILPLPHVTVTDVKVANAPGAKAPEILHIKEASASVALWPLLKKIVEVKSITLEEMVLNLQKLKDGSNNWDFLTADKKPEDAGAADNTEADTSGFKVEFSPEINVANSRVAYVDGADETVVEIKSFQMLFESMKGPAEIEGQIAVLGQTLSFDGDVGKIVDGDLTNIRAKVYMSGHSLEAKGAVNIDQLAFTGTLDGKVDMTGIKVPGLPLGAATLLAAKIIASKDAIELKDFKITSGEINADASAKVDLGGSKAYDISLAGLPHGTKATVHGQIGGQKGRASLSTENLAKLQSMFTGMSPDLIPKEAHGRANASANFHIEGKEYHLTNINIDVAGRSLTGDASVSDKVRKFDIKSPNAAAWMSLLSGKPDSGSGIKAIGIQGKASGPTDNMDLDVVVNIGNGYISAKGKLGKNQQFNGSFGLSSPNLNGFLTALGSNPGVILGAAKLDAKIVRTQQMVKLSGIKGTLSPRGKTVAFSGQVDVNTAAAKPAINGALNVESLPLSAMMSQLDIDLQVPDQPYVTASAKKDVIKSKKASTFKGWSSAPIDMSGLRSVNADLKIKVNQLIYAPLKVNNLLAEIRLNNGVLDITSLRGGVFGGQLVGSGQLNGNATPSAKANMNISGASFQRIAEQAGNTGIKGGNLDAGLNISTQGASEKAMVSGLNGLLTVRASNGTIEGIDLEALTDSLKSLNSAMGIVSVFATSLEGGSTKFNTLDVHAPIKGGIATVQKLHLDAPVASSQGKGVVNLNAWNIDIKGDLNLKQLEKLPEFGYTVHGPIDAPNVGVDTSFVAQKMLEGVGKTILKEVIGGGAVGIPGAGSAIGAIGGAIGSILGGEDSENKDAPDSGGSDPKPEDIVKDLLPGLF